MTYKNFKDRNEETTTKAPVYQGCKYGGCKFPAGVVVEPGVYVCRLHDGVSFTDADKVTTLARNRRIPYRIAYVLINAPTGATIPAGLKRQLDQVGYGHVITNQNGSARRLGTDLMAVLDKECLAHTHKPAAQPTVKPEVNADWYQAGEAALARFMS